MKIISDNKTNTNKEQRYIYISVPLKYSDIAKELIQLLSDFGKEMIDSCNSICTKKGKVIIESWNTLQIAMIAYEQNRYEDCDKMFESIHNKITNFSYTTYTIDDKYDIYVNKDIICIYHKLLSYIASLDSSKFLHCDDICNCDNKFVIKLLNIFYSAIANFNIHKEKVSNFLIHYIEAELKNKYKEEGKEEKFENGINIKLDETTGNLLSYISCGEGETARFDVNPSTGELVQIGESKLKYDIIDDNLVITNKN